MNSTDFAQLKGKVARNVYAIIKFELMEQVTSLSSTQEKEMAEYFYETIKASNKSIKAAMKSSGIKSKERASIRRRKK